MCGLDVALSLTGGMVAFQPAVWDEVEPTTNRMLKLDHESFQSAYSIVLVNTNREVERTDKVLSKRSYDAQDALDELCDFISEIFIEGQPTEEKPDTLDHEKLEILLTQQQLSQLETLDIGLNECYNERQEIVDILSKHNYNSIVQGQAILGISKAFANSLDQTMRERALERDLK